MALTADQALTKLQKLYERLDGRRLEFERREGYFRGRQPLRFASDKWREYNASRYEKFADNWCAPVANSANERLAVEGFRLTDDPQISDAEKSLWQDWQANDMEAQSSQGFLASIITSRSAVMVWGDPDTDEPAITWEKPDQVVIDYDPQRPTVRLAAVKTWCDDDAEYATLYMPDGVWKFQRPRVYMPRVRFDGLYPPDGAGQYPAQAEAFFATDYGLIIPTPDKGGWVQRQDSGDDTWPLANPLGVVPLVEFQNRPMLGDHPMSEITGAMCMQDAVNLLWAYLFAAADFASMPARVVMGQDPPMMPILNDQGQQVGEKPIDMKKLAEDRILWLTGEQAKIGQWDPAKLDVFTNTIESCVAHLAAQTRTPPHYMLLGKGLVNINADGMRAAEVGAVMKAKESHTFWTPSVRELFRMTALARDDRGLADACRFGSVHWKDAENRSQAQQVDALQKLQAIGFPFEWIAEQYGLSQTEVQRVLDMKEREAELDPIGAATRLLAQQGAGAIPAGQLPPAASPME